MIRCVVRTTASMSMVASLIAPATHYAHLRYGGGGGGALIVMPYTADEASFRMVGPRAICDLASSTDYCYTSPIELTPYPHQLYLSSPRHHHLSHVTGISMGHRLL
jgi:non-ribosomal peptide synthetase component E (peptide arylation enzyme)